VAKNSQSERQPVALLDLKGQYSAIEAEVREAMDRVLRSQQFILGAEVEQLESEIAEYSGCQFGIGVSSGTDALTVALMAAGIKPGDEVITTPYTFFATAGCIARLGARAVFVDIDARTYNICAADIEAAVSPRSKAIIPVHLFGQMAEMDPIVDIARRHNLLVIEDAAQAIGAEYDNRRAGSVGEMGCFSFFPTKNLGAFGDGGMVTTNDSELAERIRILRGHGSNPKYIHKVVGGNFRLDALQAAVLRVKLKYLDSWSAARQRNATNYRRLFEIAGLASAGVNGGRAQRDSVILPEEAPRCRHVFNQFVIRVARARRDPLLSYLKEQQIGSEIYYPVPLHLQECFADLGYRPGDFPQSEAAAAETLALPIYPELTEGMQAVIVEALARFFRR
jgi:dTDP-4-amino-4,6-dideoxygalactose transaminase